jgi:hypothetical protein
MANRKTVKKKQYSETLVYKGKDGKNEERRGRIDFC